MTPAERAVLVEQFRGQSGPVRGWEEHIVAQEDDAGNRVVILSTTRPATVADLLESEREVISVATQADYIRVTMPGDEYRAGGVTGALRRRVNMSDEARAAAGERLAAARKAGSKEADDAR